mgnify:FL=1
MTISAKYPSRCAVCGGTIVVGAKIEWAKGQPARHTACPAAAPAKARKSTAPRAPSPAAVAGEKTVSRDSRDRHDGYMAGEVLHLLRVSEGGGADGHVWVVVEAGKRRGDEDNQEFSPWVCWARVRPATTEEAAPVEQARAAPPPPPAPAPPPPAPPPPPPSRPATRSSSPS